MVSELFYEQVVETLGRAFARLTEESYYEVPGGNGNVQEAESDTTNIPDEQGGDDDHTNQDHTAYPEQESRWL